MICRLNPRKFLATPAFILPALLFVVAGPIAATAQPSPAATAAYNSYILSVESRLARQHNSPSRFLANLPAGSLRRHAILHGTPLLEDLAPASPNLSGALLHHWRATAFVPGVTAAEFSTLLRNFPAYPTVFAPQVQRAAILGGSGDSFRIAMRLREHRVITVVLDLTCAVRFHMLDASHGSSSSSCNARSHTGSAGDSTFSSGFLWRMNTYWSYEQGDGGLYLQIESVSLSRSIPFGLAWAVRPYAESIPRDSLTFTLNAAHRALQHESRVTAESSPSQPLAERTHACNPCQ